MDECRDVTRDMLPNLTTIEAQGKTPGFAEAKRKADEKARELASDPFLLAWFDRSTGAFSPDVTCCGDEKPTWLVYAESRGGDLAISVGDLDYVFVYASGF